MTELSVDPHAAFTADVALSALTAACQELGLSADGADLIRLGSNAVFRLAHDVIARVAPSDAALPNAELQIHVAQWLAALDYPAVRAIPVDQPVQAAGRVVTFWRSIAPKTAYAPIGQVAELIRRLHELAPPVDFALPPLRPFGAPDDPLPTFAGLDDTDRAFLRQRLAWARRTFPTLDFPLGIGPIHGDANVGNVLLDPDGHAVLIDLDSFAVGPARVGPHPDRAVRRPARVAQRGRVPDVRRSLRLRHHDLGRVRDPRGHARDRDDSVAEQESRWRRARRSGGAQAHHRHAHRREPARLGRSLSG